MYASRRSGIRDVSRTKEISISEGSGGRWWENYLIRYLVGTVMGAGCIWILMKTLRQDVAVPDFLNPGIVGQSNYLLILAVCGFAYCYVASQLVLVVHVWRFSIEFKWKRASGEGSDIIRWLRRNPLSAVVAYVILAGGLSWLSNRVLSGAVESLALGWQLAIGFIGVQYLMCIDTFGHHRRLYDFYESLASARVLAKKEGAELIDSYRHMREHGNAFFILLAEIIFLGYLFGCQHAIYGYKGNAIPSIYSQVFSGALFATLWIVPGAAVWFVATSIEHRFCNWDYARR